MSHEVDLHIHSNHSDGRFPPEKIVSIAAERNLSAISITDHDNVSGVKKAMEVGAAFGIEIIPGIELSVQKNNHDIHLLGYFIDTDHPKIVSYLAFFREERLKRARKIIEKLARLKVNIEWEAVLIQAGAAPIGRVHIADLIVKKGCAKNIYEAFDLYIGDSAPASAPRAKISHEETIQLINSAGGLSFIAHPGVDITETALSEMVDAGLNGIETIHPRHSRQQRKYYSKLAAKYNLLESGGSDCHGDRFGASIIGKLDIPYEFVAKMKTYEKAVSVHRDAATQNVIREDFL